VNVKSQGNLTRISSLNHPVNVSLSENKHEALVCLKDDLDKTSVPHKDFVLLLRDDLFGKPVGI
jgi:hypothetical protein